MFEINKTLYRSNLIQFNLSLFYNNIIHNVILEVLNSMTICLKLIKHYLYRILKYVESFKAKLTNSELWMGGGNARFNSSAVFHSIVAAAGSYS